MWELVQTAAIFVILVLNIYAFTEYRKIRRLFATAVRKMDCDGVIDQLLSLDDDAPVAAKSAPVPVSAEGQELKRGRLAAIVAGGSAKKYLGKQLTLAQVDEMTDDEVSKHYGRYEARLGASMTKTLGSSALQMYAMLAGPLLPIPPENLPKLVLDLEDDPFVGHALTTACCELYYRYGMYLAPLTAAMTTAKHCQQVRDSGSIAYDDGDAAASRGDSRGDSRDDIRETSRDASRGDSRDDIRDASRDAGPDPGREGDEN